MSTLKQINESSIEKSSVKSSVSDYLVFVIGLALVILSNFSELNLNNNKEADFLKESHFSNDPSAILNDFSSIRK